MSSSKTVMGCLAWSSSTTCPAKITSTCTARCGRERPVCWEALKWFVESLEKGETHRILWTHSSEIDEDSQDKILDNWDLIHDRVASGETITTLFYTTGNSSMPLMLISAIRLRVDLMWTRLRCPASRPTVFTCKVILRCMLCVPCEFP